MARTRAQFIDVMAAAGGVILLVLVLALVDHRLRDSLAGAGGLTGAGDLATLGEDVNYLAMATAVVVAHCCRGQIAEQMHLLVFTITAVVLVVLLMRL